MQDLGFSVPGLGVEDLGSRVAMSQAVGTDLPPEVQAGVRQANT